MKSILIAIILSFTFPSPVSITAVHEYEFVILKSYRGEPLPSIKQRLETTNGMCEAFVEWQDIMRKGGYPETDYAKTGMEKRCPGMV